MIPIFRRTAKPLALWGAMYCAASSDFSHSDSQVLFLGTGSSIGTPIPIHLMKDAPKNSRLTNNYLVSRKAALGDPRFNKNYRCNPSILIRYKHDEDEKNIVVDMGKTFRESVVRWFPANHVTHVDAVVLTHGHADAIFGLDDVRSIQNVDGAEPMPVYLTQDCEKVVRKVFFYLFPDDTPGAVKRHVSNIKCIPIEYYEKFNIHGLNVFPFPVMHGEDLKSLGFVFGNQDKLCYISDISRMIPASLQAIKQQGEIDLLIVDALAIDYQHPTHFSLDQAIALCREIRPKRTLLVGMGSGIDHEEVNTKLKLLQSEEGIDIQLAYDGLSVNIQL